MTIYAGRGGSAPAILAIEIGPDSRSQGEPVVTLDPEQDGSPYCVAVSDDGRLVAAGTTRGRVLTWRADNARQQNPVGPDRWNLDYGKVVMVIQFVRNPPGHLIAAGDENGLIGLFELGREARALPSWGAHRGGVTGLAVIGNDGLVSTGQDGMVRQWSLAGQKRRELQAGVDPEWSRSSYYQMVEPSSDGSGVWILDRSGHLVEIALESWAIRTRGSGPHRSACMVGEQLVTLDDSGAISIHESPENPNGHQIDEFHHAGPELLRLCAVGLSHFALVVPDSRNEREERVNGSSILWRLDGRGATRLDDDLECVRSIGGRPRVTLLSGEVAKHDADVRQARQEAEVGLRDGSFVVLDRAIVRLGALGCGPLADWFRAKSMASQGRLVDALETLLAITDRDNLPEWSSDVASVLDQLEEYTAARDFWEEALQRHPDDTETRLRADRFRERESVREFCQRGRQLVIEDTGHLSDRLERESRVGQLMNLRSPTYWISLENNSRANKWATAEATLQRFSVNGWREHTVVVVGRDGTFREEAWLVSPREEEDQTRRAWYRVTEYRLKWHLLLDTTNLNALPQQIANRREYWQEDEQAVAGIDAVLSP